jgi:PPOX class probable FMN-dependent enzyme
MSVIDSVIALEACYPELVTSSEVETEVDHLTPHYRALVEASPFAAVATLGPRGLDCAPYGGPPGFVRIVDDATLALPERRGGDRLDVLRNILSDNRVVLLFLIPNASTPLRITGRAVISADPQLLASFGPRDAPGAVVIVTVDSARFHPPKAVLRAGLWSPVTWGNPEHLPSHTEMLEAFRASSEPDRLLQGA